MPALLYSQTWNALGTDGSGCVIYALKEWNNKLYAGPCVSVNNKLISGVCSFNEQKFDSLGNGLQLGGAIAFTKHDNKLYVGGQFVSADSIPNSASVAGWNDTAWSSANNNYFAEINAAASYNGELYVGGQFTQIGGITAKCLAKWNGTTWSTVGGGFTGQVEVDCMAIYNGELYVGGQLGLPGGPNNNFYNLVRWNGTQWDSVGGQFGGGYVMSLCVDTINNVLYAGGGITFAGTVPVWSVAKWDGTNLSSPGGFGITNGAYSMCMYNNELYVGGSGFSDTTLAKYDGVNWTPIIPSPNEQVQALAVYDSNLYVGGWFTQVGTVNANYIACYGNTCPQGVGINEFQISDLKFKVFPNPAKNNITIETEENKNFVARITNQLGQQIIKENFQKKLEVDISKYGKGIFLVEVCNEKDVKCHTEKVIIH